MSLAIGTNVQFEADWDSQNARYGISPRTYTGKIIEIVPQEPLYKISFGPYETTLPAGRFTVITEGGKLKNKSRRKNTRRRGGHTHVWRQSGQTMSDTCVCSCGARKYGRC